MPLWKCSACHHEWEGARNDHTCDWCGAKNASVLERHTELERMLNGMRDYNRGLEDLIALYRHDTEDR